MWARDIATADGLFVVDDGVVSDTCQPDASHDLHGFDRALDAAAATGATSTP